MIVGTSVSAFAAEPSIDKATATKMHSFSVDEVKALEPFVSIREGQFVLDREKALACGIDADLIDGQEVYFNYLNSQARNGKIIINKDLSITSAAENVSPKASSGHWSSCGGGRNTSTTNYWWGYARYACDCETRRMSSDFNSCASVAAGIGVVGAYFGGIGAVPGGLSSAYFWLLASRLDANNHGRGVYIEMTWALVFDITPQ